ncbi:phosphoribulokinase [Lysinibacillus sp. 1 U-2021]|uniref:uridine kinase family protein n=1 Tax=Lysinibacillus sp. 1 U-2021 TaxID=3039426 RepID=UPI002481696D|nr:phosphoribulokinase [Lysinibacillus sp. 1 U-2021]WGT40324.1 phosphoribulokinase [Lysinibacillus sp. 1 U-2021]
METILKEILKWVKQADNKIIIGISGHGAAGKTTFAKKLIHALDQDEVNYLNTDPYIVNSDIRKQTILNYTYQNEHHRFKMTACHPAAHHLPSLERDVQMIRAGLDFMTIDTNYMKSTLISSKKQITIVEGMCVAFIDPQLLDLKIYFYTDGATELKRRSDRDVLERGTDINYLKQSHDERRIQYELFMHPHCQHFDMVIKTQDDEILIEKNTLVK